MPLLCNASFKEFGSLVCLWQDVKLRKKRSLRSGHLMRPGHVTFGVIGSSFFGNVSNCLLNSYGKFGGAMRRRFFAAKNRTGGGGGWNQPPPVRGLTLYSSPYDSDIAVLFEKNMENIKKIRSFHLRLGGPKHSLAPPLIALGGTWPGWPPWICPW